jgi:hypothetical protein
VRNIAFVGPMHSGKTTASNYLVEHYGYQRISLADGVKQLASDMLTEAAYLLTGNCKHPTVAQINTNKATFRPFLQWLGTDFVREYLGMPTYWIDSFLLAAQESTKPVVCDDVRFVNEAEALKRAGFEIVRLKRNEAERLGSIAAAGGNPNDLAHKSETELDKIDADTTLSPNAFSLPNLLDYHLTSGMKVPYDTYFPPIFRSLGFKPGPVDTGDYFSAHRVSNVA